MINSVVKYKEPQINADERRLNASFLNNKDAEFFRDHREFHQNLWKEIDIDVNQSGIKRKLLAIINDKINATNLRLSAFICGLKFDNTRQLCIISNVERLVLLFVNHSKRVI